MKFKFKKEEQRLLFVLALSISISIIAIFSYQVGYQVGADLPKDVVITNITNTDAPEDLKLTTNFDIFWEAWGALKEKHPNIGDIPDIDLIYGAITGLTEAIGDQNTIFFSPEDSKKFNEDISGSFSGIGVEIGMKDGQLIIVAPLKNTPAQKAGLIAGDEIHKINGKSTNRIMVEDAVKEIRGDAGTTIVLTIMRDGFSNPRDFSVVREKIQIPVIDVNMLEGDVLYIQLHNFSGTAPSAFAKAMVDNSSKPVSGIILDLRNNPGGFLDAAVKLAGWFLDRGEVVAIQRFSSGEDRIYKAEGNGALKDIPVVILVNGGSASASEILAGALRVHNDSQLVGKQTFGKGTVQQLEPLSDGSTLKVTIANWLLPDETLIEETGLTPNFVVDLTEQDAIDKKDPQLEKAIELIKK